MLGFLVLCCNVCQDDYEEERETNLSAAMAALRLWGDEEPVCIQRDLNKPFCICAAHYLLFFIRYYMPLLL